MGRVIVVAGIPGMGKTTVLDKVRQLTKESGQEVKVINYGTVMTNLSSESGELLYRDDIRRSRVKFQRELQEAAAKIISNKAAESPSDLIVDTHMSINTGKGYLAGLPLHVLNQLNPEMLILIEAKPAEAMSRRLKDSSRKRDSALKERIEEEILFSRLMAAACSVLTGAPLMIVVNAAGEQLAAAEEIVKMLKRG